MELEGNREVIYGAQSLAGKILVSKSLRSLDCDSPPVSGRKRARRTVTASAMIAHRSCGRQGQMSQRGLWKSVRWRTVRTDEACCLRALLYGNRLRQSGVGFFSCVLTRDLKGPLFHGGEVAPAMPSDSGEDAELCPARRTRASATPRSVQAIELAG